MLPRRDVGLSLPRLYIEHARPAGKAWTTGHQIDLEPRQAGHNALAAFDFALHCLRAPSPIGAMAG